MSRRTEGAGRRAADLEAKQPVVVIADDDLKTLETIRDLLHDCFPRLHILTTNSVQPSVNVLLEAQPTVVISGLDPDRVRGYNFLRRAGDVAPRAYKLLVTSKHWDRQLLDDLDILAALRRPPEPATLVDLVGGLVYGDMDPRLEEAAA